MVEPKLNYRDEFFKIIQMFTGIIECIGTIQSIQKEENNFHFVVASEISTLLKPDQSVAHDGVCLTVTSCNDKTHSVTAIAETISRTTLECCSQELK